MLIGNNLGSKTYEKTKAQKLIFGCIRKANNHFDLIDGLKIKINLLFFFLG